MTSLDADPLVSNVRAEAVTILLHAVSAHQQQLDDDGWIQLEGRVWLHQTDQPEHGGVCFHFALDPTDEEDSPKFLFCFLVYGADLAADLELLPTEQETLFWWAMWLADFRGSIASNLTEANPEQW